MKSALLIDQQYFMKLQSLIQYSYPIYWLNATATISHLCKMIAATIQGRLLFKGSIYCNVMMIAVATIQKPGSFMVHLLYTTQYLHDYKFS